MRSGASSATSSSSTVHRDDSMKEYWVKLVSSRMRVAKAEDGKEAESAERRLPVDSLISDERLAKLLNDNYDICWDFNGDDGCIRGKTCGWRHERLTLRLPRVAEPRTIKIEHPTQIGMKVNIHILPAL